MPSDLLKMAVLER